MVESVSSAVLSNFKAMQYRGHFTNDFSIVIEIRWKIVYVVIYFLAITSLQRCVM